MIPSDLIARLRLLNETFVQPLAPGHETASDLPEFQIGQRFSARIEAVLPDNTFRALVAGRTVTLALPESAKPGDSLDLVVLDRTPRMLVASRAGGAAPAPGPASAPVPAPTLSQAGQIISSLLAQSPGTTASAELVRATPLLAQPPSGPAVPVQAPQALPGASTVVFAQTPLPAPQQAPGLPPSMPQGVAAAAVAALQAPPSPSAALALALQQAITESGLFYESHQAQWVAGRLPLADLMREPQARHGPGSTTPRATPAVSVMSAETPSSKSLAGVAEPSVRSAPNETLPPELRPLVQQQLDAATNQQILWRGEVWPGQTMHWEISEEQRRRDASETEAAQWRTRVRLVMPQLGELTADLTLAQTGVSIRFTAAEGESAGALRDAQPELAAALGAAGVPLIAMKVDRG